MSSITKKFKKSIKFDIQMSMRFSCKLCGFQRLIPQSEFLKMKKVILKQILFSFVIIAILECCLLPLKLTFNFSLLLQI